MKIGLFRHITRTLGIEKQWSDSVIKLPISRGGTGIDMALGTKKNDVRNSMLTKGIGDYLFGAASEVEKG
jgi:hypothetical protein